MLSLPPRLFVKCMLLVLSVGGLWVYHSSSQEQEADQKHRPWSTSAPVVASTKTRGSNIVFILTDDLTWNLVQYMPHVLQMQQEGVTFAHYFVTDSLCCPSRASIFTGRYPHNTGIYLNDGPDGG